MLRRKAESKVSYIAKAHSSMDDNTQNLGPWSSLYDLQAGLQVWDSFTLYSLLLSYNLRTKETCKFGGFQKLPETSELFTS